MGLIVGITYAYIAYYARQSEVNVLRADCMKIEFKEKTNAITLSSVIPISDEEGTNTRPYIFEITNTCGVGMNYNVNLEVLTIKEGIELSNLIESKNIATKIDDLEVKKLTSEIATTPTYDESDYKATESYTMYTGLLNPGETKSHEVRVWLHYSAGNETQNKNFYSKVVIEGIQNEVANLNFSEYIMNKKDTSIEKIEHEATEQTPALTDYRYVGANPNNYVYFGCDGSDCTSDNLYRIIGVIPTQSSDTSSYKNRVKLIKATNWEGTTAESGSTFTKSGKGYQWNTTSSNKWESSSLQQTLNNEYYNSLGEYKDYIEQAKWYLGAPNHDNRYNYTSEELYAVEKSNKQGYSNGKISFIGNIGLMYLSDFGLSIGNTYKNEIIYVNYEQFISNSWLFNLSGGAYREWTMQPNETSSSISWVIGYDGIGGFTLSRIVGVRPTFYLKANVLYSKGDGTQTNPYRISL